MDLKETISYPKCILQPYVLMGICDGRRSWLPSIVFTAAVDYLRFQWTTVCALFVLSLLPAGGTAGEQASCCEEPGASEY